MILLFSGCGTDIYYEFSGSGGRVLLLLHGWGGSCENWLPVARDFSAVYRVLSVDFPGFGKSPEPAAPWSVDDYARATLKLLEFLNITDIDLIAHSFGGRVALKLNDMAPKLVRRQVLTGCAGVPPKKTFKSKLRAGVFRALRALAYNKLTRALLGGARAIELRDKARARFGSSDYRSASPLMRQTLKRVIDEDLTPCLKRVRASTLLVWGDRDTATPLWMGRKMEAEITDAGLVVFENAGHFAYLEQYQRFLAVARKFLLD